ncbi:ankyrin and het domain protein [Seiridium cupressi]
MSPYVYQPIPDTGYIRVLTLEPGAYDDDIVVHISRVPFDPAYPPQYEAFSYVWGSEENKKAVFVRNRGRSTVTVTRNLDVALRHLRYGHKDPRVMWVDAICIDQGNEKEKGPQVARMGQVFKCAARVLVWLGPEQNHSDLAMQLISYVGPQISVSWPPFLDGSAPWSLRHSTTAHDKSLTDLEAPWPFNHSQISAVFHLFSRKWFKRLWIRQEIYLNEDRGIVICGKSQVSWTCMRNVLAAFYYKTADDAPQWSSTLMAELRSLIFQYPYISLENLIRGFGSSDCKDPRDRIYAILSLLGPSTAILDIRPDYTKPAAFVYKDTTRKYIMQFGLDILKQCQFTTNISNPSWVPDWTTKLEIRNTFDCAFASSQLDDYSQFLDSDILSVAGTVITTVGTLYDLDGEYDQHDQLYLREFSESLRKLFIQIDPNTDENKDDAVAIYAEVLYADGPTLTGGVASDNNQDLADVTRFLSRLYTNGVQSALRELGFADPRLAKFPNFKGFLEARRNNENVFLKVHPQLLRDNGVNIQYFNLV